MESFGRASSLWGIVVLESVSLAVKNGAPVGRAQWCKRSSGLFRGTESSGGKKPNGTNGFSTRDMWRAKRKDELYADLFEDDNSYGQSIGRRHRHLDGWSRGDRRPEGRFRTVKTLQIEGACSRPFSAEAT